MMKWENLKDDLCPYCKSHLQEEEPFSDNMKCSRCKFRISKARMEKKKDSLGGVVLKWQNLIFGKCPICSGTIIPVRKSTDQYYKCSEEECGFKISDIRLKEMIENPDSIANKFYKQEHYAKQTKNG